MNGLSRRTLCCGVVGLTLGLATHVRAEHREVRRIINLSCVHTGERFEEVYWEHGEYLPDALSQINYLMRDLHREEIAEIDPSLIDLLWLLAGRARTSHPFTVLSGYRSPKTNRMLQHQGYNAASHSMHLVGKAVDIQLPGMASTRLYHIARMLQSGGVGIYPNSGIIHVDTGPIRQWILTTPAHS